MIIIGFNPVPKLYYFFISDKIFVNYFAVCAIKIDDMYTYIVSK